VDLRNPLGVHALVWAGDTSPASVEYAVAQTAKTGFDLLEISLHDSINLDVPAAKAQLEAAGLQVACSRGLAFDADVSSDDSAVVARGEKLLHDSLMITSELGGTHFTGALYSALGKYGAPLSEAGRRMNIEEDEFVRPVLEVGDRLGYVHIGENHRGYLGSGHIDFAGFFHALSDISYTGPITFESFSSAVVSPTLSNDLSIWRNLWNDGPELARHAREYMVNAIDGASRVYS